MKLILNDIAPYHWAVGGAGIALVTLAMLALTNRRLGISAGFDNLCSLVVNAPYFRHGSLTGSHSWRLPFLGGLVMGGALSAVVGGGTWATTWDLGVFDAYIKLGPIGKCAWMFVGGAFIGFGTRMAGGCTSGHGIFGISNFESAGIVSTISFMAAGIATTNLIYRVGAGF